MVGGGACRVIAWWWIPVAVSAVLAVVYIVRDIVLTQPTTVHQHRLNLEVVTDLHDLDWNWPQ